MCNHLYEELIPVFDEYGNLECADGVLCCHLLDDAEAVLDGVAVYAESFDMRADGWHRELRYTCASVSPAWVEQYDPEIPF